MINKLIIIINTEQFKILYGILRKLFSYLNTRRNRNLSPNQGGKIQ